MKLPLHKLRAASRDENGIAAVEFALISPVFMVLLLGTMDLGHSLYVQAVLQGAVQKAARDSSLQTGTLQVNQDAIDANVREQALKLNKTATVSFTRRSYYTYAEASAKRPEQFTDSTTNPNGICDNNEAYVDANDNDVWDDDGAVAGQGGARDKAVYTVHMRYPRWLPIDKFVPGINHNIDITASTVLANQPYGEQQITNSTTVKHCSP